MTDKILLTLSFPQNQDRVLLGMKKRGFGKGLWNGFGGKVEEGESIMEAAKRELIEEVGITALTMNQLGLLQFTFINEPGILHEVHVFSIPEFTDPPRHSEEMQYRWFMIDKLPYQKMHQADRHWLPRVLQGKKIKATFHYGSAGQLLGHKIEEFIESLF